jgi:phosphoribosylglycinamide formyltransferase-1
MNLGILISGRGSNLRALVAAVRARQVRGRVALVVSNVPAAPGLAWAGSEGLPTACLPHRQFPSREAHDEAILAELRRRGVELVCLAGYMRLLGPAFVRAYPLRILNIHPSLLPAFPGLEAQRRAWEAGVKVSGATVHFVDEELDHGPILAQEAVPVLEDDTPDTLAARILEVEHRLYPLAVSLLCDGRVEVEGRRVRIRGPHP